MSNIEILKRMYGIEADVANGMRVAEWTGAPGGGSQASKSMVAGVNFEDAMDYGDFWISNDCQSSF